MTEFRYVAEDEAATDRLGQLLAEVLPPGTVIALSGTLGAGKTRLVQSVAVALGIPRDEVTSPTFVLMNEYRGGRLPIYHFDVYRLADDDEFLQLGPEEYFEGDGICIIEWADRVTDCLPRERVEIRIAVTGETSRAITITATSDRFGPLVEQLSILVL